MSYRAKPKQPQQPNPISAALDEAVAALRAGAPREAERLAHGVLKSNWGNALAARILGEALLVQRRAAEASTILERAARRSRDPGSELWLAHAMFAQDRGAEAVEVLYRAIRRRPPFPPAFLELGDRLREQGRFDESAAVLESGLSLVPDAIVLVMGLGYTHLEKGDRQRAQTIFLEVTAAAPGRHDALCALGRVAALEGDYSAAADLYSRALELRPDDALARVELGKSLLEQGEREAGEAALRRVARQAPDLVGPAATALSATPHGRLFLRPSRAAAFLS